MSEGLQINLGLSDEKVTELATAAVMNSIDSTTRDALIQQSIKHLLTLPPASSYSSVRISPLQSAFNTAMDRVAVQIATELLTSDNKVKDEIKLLINEAWNKIVDSEKRENIVSKMSDAFVKVLSGDRY